MSSPIGTERYQSMLLADKDFYKFDFDPLALKKKYLEERDKRRNDKGNDQYQWMQTDNQFGELLKDPWMAPLNREPVNMNVRALVIGGGFSAIMAGRFLREAGIDDFVLVEKAGDFGGTWYWNRYPGAACDSEAYCYLPYLEECNYMPQNKYASSVEILEHSARMGKRWNLYEKTFFQTETKEVRWDDALKRWRCTTDRGDVFIAQFVLSASGPLHKPKLSGTKGVDKFKGVQFHTSRWNYQYTGGSPLGGLAKLADKRVAVIGTGATAIQCVPHVGEWAKHLYVFQRTPSTVDARNNQATDAAWWREYTKKSGWQAERDLNFAKQMLFIPVKEDLIKDGWTDVWNYTRMLLDAKQKGKPEVAKYSDDDLLQLADMKKMELLRRRVDAIVKDPKTAAALKPWYNRMCKRPTFSDTYLPTFNRPNVTLVDTMGKGVEEITEKGVKANGVEYEVDCIIWSTGFEIGTSWKSRNGYELYGKGGITLQQKWRKGFKSLFGISTREFPNFAMMQPAQASASINFPLIFGEQAKFFVYLIKACKDQGIEWVDVTEEAEKKWAEEIVEKSRLQKKFLEECTPGYYNFEGQVNRLVARNTSHGGGPLVYMQILDDWKAAGKLEGLELHHFGEDAKPRL